MGKANLKDPTFDLSVIGLILGCGRAFPPPPPQYM
jgi:hypothetical protein